MSWLPHVTVAAVLEQNNRFLLVEEEIAGQRCYNQPAGHLERGESLLDAVAREVLEETAYGFIPQYLVGIYHWQNPSTEVTFVRFCFGGEIVSHAPERVLDEGIIAAHWLRLDEITALQSQLRSPMILSGFNDFMAGKRYPLDLVTYYV